MAIIRLGLSGMSAPEKTAFSLHLLDSMSGNANFPNAATHINELSNAKTELEQAHVKTLNGDRMKRAIAKLKELALDEAIRTLAFHVESESKGDIARILSAGFEIRRSRTPVAVPDAPKIEVSRNGYPGEAKIRWDPVKGSRTYIVQVNRQQPGQPAVWEYLAAVTRSGYKASGLSPGIMYSFRVVAVNSAGQSPFSNMADYSA